jgi:hypothetical protein
MEAISKLLTVLTQWRYRAFRDLSGATTYATIACHEITKAAQFKRKIILGDGGRAE